MRHLTILVDMDDTIENLAEAWVAYLNARHQTSTDLSDITDWDISKAFPTLTKEQVYAPLLEDALELGQTDERRIGGTAKANRRRTYCADCNYIELSDAGG